MNAPPEENSNNLNFAYTWTDQLSQLYSTLHTTSYQLTITMSPLYLRSMFAILETLTDFVNQRIDAEKIEEKLLKIKNDLLDYELMMGGNKKLFNKRLFEDLVNEMREAKVLLIAEMEKNHLIQRFYQDPKTRAVKQWNK